MAFSFLTQELAIDLGTANTVIFQNDKIVLDEPSIVAIDQNTSKPIAFGHKARLMHEREQYLALHGTEPSLAVLAELAEVSAEEAAVAMESTAPVHSLSEPIGDDELLLENVIPSADDSLHKMVEQIALQETIKTLPPLWKKILLLRYFRDYSQQQTADALGLTQVKISREEKKIFNRLREELA